MEIHKYGKVQCLNKKPFTLKVGAAGYSKPTVGITWPTTNVGVAAAIASNHDFVEGLGSETRILAGRGL